MLSERSESKHPYPNGDATDSALERMCAFTDAQSAVMQSSGVILSLASC